MGILGPDLLRAYLDYAQRRETHLVELDPRPKEGDSEWEKVCLLEAHLKEAAQEPLPGAAMKLQKAADRKARKRGKELAPRPLGVQVPNFFLAKHNPVLAGCRAWEQDVMCQNHHMQKANHSRIFHKMVHLHHVLLSKGCFGTCNLEDTWPEVAFLELYFGNDFFFLGRKRLIDL